MLIYPLIFGFSILFAYQYSNTNKKYFQKLSFLMLFLPAAFRYQVGVDFNAYSNIFEYTANGIPVLMEPGYLLINYIVYKMGGTFQVVVAFMSFSTLYFAFASFPKKHYHHCVALFSLVFYQWTYTTLRQMLVVSFAYYCYVHLFLNKKYLKSYILLGTASFIHLSGFLYIIVFAALRRVTLNRLSGFYIFIGSLFLIPFGSSLIEFIFSVLLSGTKYDVYQSMTTPSGQAAEASTGLGRVLRFIIYFLFLLPLIIYTDNKQSSHGIIFMLLIIIFDILAQHMGVFSRISRAFLFGYFVIIIAIVNGKSRYRQVLLTLLYVGLSVLFFGNMLNGVNLPYRTIFG